MERMAERSEPRLPRARLRATPDFVEFFHAVTPVEEISRLQLGSRPAKRGADGGIEDFRAIPWVFSWTQARIVLPAWYGLGTALRGRARGARRCEVLREMERELAVLRRAARQRRDGAAPRPTSGSRAATSTLCEDEEPRERIWGAIVAEFERTRASCCASAGEERLLDREPVLQRSIDRRNPYVDPLSFVQVELLRRACARGDGRRPGAHVVPHDQRHRRRPAQHGLTCTTRASSTTAAASRASRGSTGGPTHETIEARCGALDNLEHRGAAGADAETGDGAGILIQMPDALLRAEVGFDLPAAGRYGVGVLLPAARRAPRARAVEALLERGVEAEGQTLLGWRDVPVDPSVAGRAARGGARRSSGSCSIGAARRRPGADAFERKLYVIRRRVENARRRRRARSRRCSSRTMVYKGMLPRPQLRALLPRPARRATAQRAGDRPLALLDQHVPELGARAPVPLPRPQRRDQHAARQRQLDARPRERSCESELFGAT